MLLHRGLITADVNLLFQRRNYVIHHKDCTVFALLYFCIFNYFNYLLISYPKARPVAPLTAKVTIS